MWTVLRAYAVAGMSLLQPAYADTGVDTDPADTDVGASDTDVDSDSAAAGGGDTDSGADSAPATEPDTDASENAVGSASALSGEEGGLGCAIVRGSSWNLLLGAAIGIAALALRPRRV